MLLRLDVLKKKEKKNYLHPCLPHVCINMSNGVKQVITDLLIAVHKLKIHCSSSLHSTGISLCTTVNRQYLIPTYIHTYIQQQPVGSTDVSQKILIYNNIFTMGAARVYGERNSVLKLPPCLQIQTNII